MIGWREKIRHEVRDGEAVHIIDGEWVIAKESFGEGDEITAHGDYLMVNGKRIDKTVRAFAPPMSRGERVPWHSHD